MARNEMEQAQFEAEEKLRASQTQFDPKIHGAGTNDLQGPSSVKELWNHIKSLMIRVEMLESAAKRKVSAFVNKAEANKEE
jgi:hypothetical protein